MIITIELPLEDLFIINNWLTEINQIRPFTDIELKLIEKINNFIT